MYPVFKKAIEDYESVCSRFESICESCSDNLKTHIKAKWLNYAYTLKSFYEWYVAVFEAKQFYDANNVTEYVKMV